MMGKYRKLPFGYEMKLGMVTTRPDEKPWVEYIFRQYITGVSLKEIAEMLSEDGTPYDADKAWNKNMVSRILADERYLGTDRFPKIIDQDMFRRVIEIRSDKSIDAIRQTEAQKMLRRKCGFPITKHIENEVIYLLNRVIREPERIHTPPATKPRDRRLAELKSDLEKLLMQMPVDEETAMEKLNQIAVAMYGAIDPREYETYRMRQAFQNEHPRTELDAGLIAMNIDAVRTDSDGNVQIILKNGQVIERGEHR